MPAYNRAFLEKCQPLKIQLGDNPIATRASRAIVRQMGIDSLSQLRRYYAKEGPEIFLREIADLRHVGPKTIEVIVQRIVSARAET